MVETLDQLTGGNWQPWFERYVYGTEMPQCNLSASQAYNSSTMLREALDRTHARVVRIRALVVFTAITRLLLALAFLPSGLVKVIGHRFTTLPVTTPVGAFFDGFFSAPAYYRFVGVAQLTAAALLLLPWTATLGAVIYFPIILNIFVITLAVGFRGTAAVTGLMLLANVYLLWWDYDRWRDLLPRAAGDRHLDLLSTLGLGATAAVGFYGVLRLHRAWLLHTSMMVPAIVVAAAAVAAVMIAVLSLRPRRRGPAAWSKSGPSARKSSQ